MGKGALEASRLHDQPYLRRYIHCSKGRVMLYHMWIFHPFFFFPKPIGKRLQMGVFHFLSEQKIIG
jgi:hypothetical protein